jgi:hypothetical protein
VRAGADVVIFRDDYADKDRPLMSPRHLRSSSCPVSSAAWMPPIRRGPTC